jgi:hypothetical protein
VTLALVYGLIGVFGLLLGARRGGSRGKMIVAVSVALIALAVAAAGGVQ